MKFSLLCNEMLLTSTSNNFFQKMDNYDCIFHIFRFLDGADIVRFGLTNKRYLEIAKEYLKLRNPVVKFRFPLNFSLRPYSFFIR